MIAFRGRQEVKDRYLARLRGHREKGTLVQGSNGWDEKTQSGGAIGCTLDDYAPLDYEESELGLPAWLAFLEEKIFELLPPERALHWPEKMLTAIKPGAVVEEVKRTYLIFILQFTCKSLDASKHPVVREFLEKSIQALVSDFSTDVLHEVATESREMETKFGQTSEAVRFACLAVYAVAYDDVFADGFELAQNVATATTYAAISAAKSALERTLTEGWKTSHHDALTLTPNEQIELFKVYEIIAGVLTELLES